MPELYFLFGYIIYVTSMDQNEPFHVHVAKRGKIKGNKVPSAKIWIGRCGEVKLAHNNGHIPTRVLNQILLSIKESKQVYNSIVKAYCNFFNIKPDQIDYYRNIEEHSHGMRR